ncbi:hypothetical protein GCM10009863_42110 [Streptomyces axinellae]|uniref:Uncharacterized protein n=1 Tax=Streptomyces axinellae TaxID=552788 RepID=A0ABN3QD69_9ACTN
MLCLLMGWVDTAERLEGNGCALALPAGCADARVRGGAVARLREGARVRMRHPVHGAVRR